jgi:hypothetical protein
VAVHQLVVAVVVEAAVEVQSGALAVDVEEILQEGGNLSEKLY